MKLEELQREAKQDLNITDQERLDQESYKNQNIKAKWLDHRTKYDQAATDVEYLTASVDFAYQIYEIEAI